MLSAENIKKRYQEILEQLSSPELLSNWEKFEELSKEKSWLEKIIAKNDEIKDLEDKLEENNQILKAQEDKELVSLAVAETEQLAAKIKTAKEDLDSMLRDENQDNQDNPASIIVEIRAGAGGEEAAIFAADLFKMYSKFALLNGWKQKTLDSSQTTIGGFKSICFELKGKDAWAKMQYEGGVHRVQRIPVTEKQGRVHTSTASVAVLPKPEKTQLKIDPKDLRIEVSKATGPGGQNVNKRMTAARVVHIPTGIAVASHTERNLQQNKENALAILSAKLLQMQEMAKMAGLSEKRRDQIKRAMRAEKIRTYNFPQDRVTDHRIKKTFHNIEGITSGQLEPIIQALSTDS